jgi:hypothetical protein
MVPKYKKNGAKHRTGIYKARRTFRRQVAVSVTAALLLLVAGIYAAAPPINKLLGYDGGVFAIWKEEDRKSLNMRFFGVSYQLDIQYFNTGIDFIIDFFNNLL